MKLEDALTATPEQATEAYDGVRENVSAHLQKVGLDLNALSTKPLLDGHEYDGTLPDNFEDLDYNGLTQLMAANVEWSRYLLGHLTQVEIEIKILQNQLSSVKSSIVKKRGKDSVESDLRYIRLNTEYTTLLCLKQAFDTAIQIAKDVYKVLSRTVTVRGQDQERVQRGENVGRGRVQFGRRV